MRRSRVLGVFTWLHAGYRIPYTSRSISEAAKVRGGVCVSSRNNKNDVADIISLFVRTRYGVMVGCPINSCTREIPPRVTRRDSTYNILRRCCAPDFVKNMGGGRRVENGRGYVNFARGSLGGYVVSLPVIYYQYCRNLANASVLALWSEI